MCLRTFYFKMSEYIIKGMGFLGFFTALCYHGSGILTIVLLMASVIIACFLCTRHLACKVPVNSPNDMRELPFSLFHRQEKEWAPRPPSVTREKGMACEPRSF